MSELGLIYFNLIDIGKHPFATILWEVDVWHKLQSVSRFPTFTAMTRIYFTLILILMILLTATIDLFLQRHAILNLNRSKIFPGTEKQFQRRWQAKAGGLRRSAVNNKHRNLKYRDFKIWLVGQLDGSKDGDQFISLTHGLLFFTLLLSDCANKLLFHTLDVVTSKGRYSYQGFL